MKIQIDDEVRDATKEEIALIQSLQIESQTLKAQRETSKEAALAKLSALGLTTDDLKALGL